MDTATAITTVGGVIFLAYTIMAGAYWGDAGRWGDRIRVMVDGPEKDRAMKNRHRAELLFRVSTSIIVITILLVVIPVYCPSTVVTNICKYLLLIPLVVFIIMCIRYTAARYFVDID